MDATLQKAFAVARAGHEGLLEGFGLERLVTAGAAVPPVNFEWEESLLLRGKGTGRLRIRRSLSDGSGEPVGSFESAIEKDELLAVLGLIQDTGLLDEAPFRLEPDDMKMRFTFILGGMQVVKFIGVNDPARLMPLQPLLTRLDGIAANLRSFPERALRVEAKMPAQAEVGLQEVAVEARLTNPGGRPYWLSHPRILIGHPRWERCSVLYGRKPEIVPGYTPLPMEVFEAQLVPAQDSGMQMVWLPAGGSQSLLLRATMQFADPGTYLGRIVYSSYEGEDQIGGVARLRGCAFSPEFEIVAS